MSRLMAYRIHARRRCRKRYGLKLTRNRYAQIVADIQAGRAEYLGRSPSGRQVWLANLGTQTGIVVYDTEDKSLVTFLKRRGG